MRRVLHRIALLWSLWRELASPPPPPADPPPADELEERRPGPDPRRVEAQVAELRQRVGVIERVIGIRRGGNAA